MKCRSVNDIPNVMIRRRQNLLSDKSLRYIIHVDREVTSLEEYVMYSEAAAADSTPLGQDVIKEYEI
jgi:hypothetical protein